MELIKKGSHIDFIGKWPYAMLFSLAMTIASIWVWVDQKEAKYGVDFRGGHDIVVRIGGEANSETIRAALEEGGVGETIVQSFEVGSQQYSIRLGGEKAEGAAEVDNAKLVRDKVQAVLVKRFGGDNVEILKTDYVGPTVGKELRTKALLATMLGLLGILIYLTFRFEFAFALGAVVGVFHDVMISTGLYLFCGYQINMGTIAAALTIVGYSVHDTIVIFDRVREEIYKRKDFNLADLMNESINATMSRTIITTLLTLFSVVALLIFGGGSISDLSFYLFVGIICGTYSTIYVASPVVLAWDHFRSRKYKSAEQPV
ncbi:MAG: protein translocase subunit SecF [Deltaproteobacteria bacterium]|nr:protein translocase subunit SecF [Deltaproteobacteria bacterium]